jgi:membrane associated rhomboid family serine protease
VILTNFNKQITDKEKMLDALLASLYFLLVCWVLFLLDEFLGTHLKQYGMRPGSPEGLRGVITMHFLHGDWKHIGHNSLAFLVLNSFLFYFYRTISIKVFAWLFFIPGLFMWFWAREENHIGASMLIFGEAGFLFVSGLLRKDSKMLRVALVVALYYGSLIWYIFPIDPTISWEGHLSGLLTGVVLAFVFKNKGPQRTPYQWELDPEEEDADPNQLLEEVTFEEVKHKEQSDRSVEIRYEYKKKDS